MTHEKQKKFSFRPTAKSFRNRSETFVHWLVVSDEVEKKFEFL